MSTVVIPSGSESFRATSDNTDYVLEAGGALVVDPIPEVGDPPASCIDMSGAAHSSLTVAGVVAMDEPDLNTSAILMDGRAPTPNVTVVVTETGHVSSETAIKIVDDGQDTSFTLVNAGEIVGDGKGLFIYSETGGPVFDTQNLIENSGLIEGGWIAIVVQQANTQIVNIGTVRAGTEDDDYGYGIDVFSGGMRIDNSGLIEVVHTGAYSAAIRSDAAIHIVNSGILRGGLYSVEGSGEADTLVNSGTLETRADLGGGKDRYFASPTGIALGGVAGGGGDDHMRGGLVGDVFTGGDGTDSLRGFGGDDSLSGEAGNDILLGDDGADVLDGGAGIDRLTGGSGADVFVFSATAGSARDVITDFVVGEDVIDLSAMGGFVSVGTAGFTGTGQAEVKVIERAGNSVVAWDVDGSARLLGSTGLRAEDFVM